MRSKEKFVKIAEETNQSGWIKPSNFKSIEVIINENDIHYKWDKFYINIDTGQVLFVSSPNLGEECIYVASLETGKVKEELKVGDGDDILPENLPKSESNIRVRVIEAQKQRGPYKKEGLAERRLDEIVKKR